ncbi:MAG: DNA (cytosine-5-)-methyltransferase [Aminipila sp.]
MLKLATVFSGIGAIEHALDRMRIEHKIIFACDNGDVDMLSKDIPANIEEIGTELDQLEKLINKIRVKTDEDQLYKDELDLMLSRTLGEFEKMKQRLSECNVKKASILVESILNTIVSQEDVKKSRAKEYSQFEKKLKNANGLNKVIECFKNILEVSNDYKKDNALEDLGKDKADFESGDGIDWSKVNQQLNKAYMMLEENTGKKVLRQVKDICERTGMLHEKINSFHILKELAQIEDYSEKKKYVDELYKGKESQNKVKKSYMANYDLGDKDFHWNIAFLDGKQYRDQVDLFVGGSPCQSFSLVGKQRGLEDTRGTLFYEYARLIKECNPKVFIYENVKAILSNDNGRTWEKMKEVFDELGYQVYYTFNGKPSVLNAKDYGIPQNRERMFVVGFRKDIPLDMPFEFPQPIKLEKKMQDFLLENVSGRYYLPTKGVDFVTSEKNLSKRFTQIDGEISLCQKKNQQFNWHGDFVFEEENKDKEKTMEELEKYFLSEKVRKYVMATGTKNFYSRPKTDLEIARPLLTTMHKMHRAGVDNYVTTDGRLRKLTPRECLRLMGFCDSFKIEVSDTSMYQQAGNSIVVDVLINIMDCIIKSYPGLIEN